MKNLIINKVSKRPAYFQFAKFFVVGLTNTGIDFAVYNFLMWITGINRGLFIVIFATVSFSVAVINSYLLNKYWTFSDKNSSKNSSQFVKFLTVALGGLVLNNSIIYYITTLLDPMFGLNPVLWANFAKAMATAAVLFWNFAGFKFLVFKK